METLTALKLIHGLATALLLGGAFGLTVWVLLGHRVGDVARYTRALQRPWVFVWGLMVLGLLALPVSGWWLVHLVGWPLGQTWLLSAGVIYMFGGLSLLWLLARLNRLRQVEATGSPVFTLALALLSGVCFIAIAALMGAKPV